MEEEDVDDEDEVDDDISFSTISDILGPHSIMIRLETRSMNLSASALISLLLPTWCMKEEQLDDDDDGGGDTCSTRAAVVVVVAWLLLL